MVNDIPMLTTRSADLLDNTTAAERQRREYAANGKKGKNVVNVEGQGGQGGGGSFTNVVNVAVDQSLDAHSINPEVLPMGVSTPKLDRAWLERNVSNVLENMYDDVDFEKLRACTKSEIENAVLKKMEGVMGKGCVAHCIVARDARHLDRAAQEWQGLNERHLQALLAGPYTVFFVSA